MISSSSARWRAAAAVGVLLACVSVASPARAQNRFASGQNIVPVFDFGRIDDQVFLAMERVEGKDLGSSLSRAADHRLAVTPGKT